MKHRGLIWLGYFLLVNGIVVYLWLTQAREHRHDAAILAAARRYGVEPALVKAVVWRESKFNPEVRGKVGELGLMQIREAAAKEWAEAEHLTVFWHSQLLDPAKNTLAGTWYLRKLLRRYPHTDNPAVFALADYNAGRGNVLKWIKGSGATNSAVFLAQMEFPGTRHYVETVLEKCAQYRPNFPGKTAK